MMKKFISLLILTTLVLSLIGCDTDTLNSTFTEAYYPSEDEETLEQIEEMSVPATVLEYKGDEEIDLSPKTEASDTITQMPSNDSEKLSFSTVDIDGNSVTDDIIKNAKLVMVNYWEPWCGPCVREMPDLQMLYEKYNEQGLLILGVFTTTYMENEARQILSECNISYPVILADSNLEKYMTEYVPTTIFADENGYIILDEPIIGANSYENWEELIVSYLY